MKTSSIKYFKIRILDFLYKKKKTSIENIIRNEPSPEQTLFTDTVLEIISPTIEEYGFIRKAIYVKKYSSKIIWRKDMLYISIESTNYPTDFPFYYNVVLAEVDNDEPFVDEQKSIALWRLINQIDPKLKAKEYSFPFGGDVKQSVLNMKKDIIKYGTSFLKGDLDLYLKTRAVQNREK